MGKPSEKILRHPTGSAVASGTIQDEPVSTSDHVDEDRAAHVLLTVEGGTSLFFEGFRRVVF